MPSSSGQRILSNAREMDIGHASFSNIGRDQIHNDHRVYGTQNNNGGGPQHNYCGSGQFISHGRDQNVYTGRGNSDVNRVQSDSHVQKTARTLAESQVDFGTFRAIPRGL
ncbi:hypothetical protein E1B28_003403 [Marasmius oreades]|uniref:Uncharacterized protein n=1 Tax=Marasmius oreades TaxID=181124 RepID=A0A9P7RMI6_9AGAR|nr:uncharacterized protein E1B28_003403 [Marasmius oreades]KAG7085870.1 hypothetical protein E1B28_003403 [Marasmius oreades]